MPVCSSHARAIRPLARSIMGLKTHIIAAAVLDAIGGHWSLPLVSWLFRGMPPVAQLLNLIRHCNDVVARFVVVT